MKLLLYLTAFVLFMYVVFKIADYIIRKEAERDAERLWKEIIDDFEHKERR